MVDRDLDFEDDFLVVDDPTRILLFRAANGYEGNPVIVEHGFEDDEPGTQEIIASGGTISLTDTAFGLPRAECGISPPEIEDRLVMDDPDYDQGETFQIKFISRGMKRTYFRVICTRVSHT